uniref:Perilipin n=1 Tax=Geotrypetes seraphini TaxID=260995 RepID=A0A6P8RKV0_GEOSA|nr:perilipin-2-like isoform X2 [Geotrypetes seraphini]
MASVAAVTQQNVVVRVVNLPLVSSTCAMVLSAYTSTKENHPYLKSACEVAEKRLKIITAVALTSAKPVIQKLEPKIALANNYACIGLDRVEAKLPILHQPADKIAANATDLLIHAKDSVAHTVNGVMEVTKATVSSSVNIVLGSHMVQMVSTGVNAALNKSEALVDHYLPLTEEEAAKEVTRIEGFEAATKSSYIRLELLSSKVYKRVYEQILMSIKDAKCKSQNALVLLSHTIGMEYAQKRLHQSWVEWKKSVEQMDEEIPTIELESLWLSAAYDLNYHLQKTCLTLVLSIQDLPQNIQDQIQRLYTMAGNIYQNFHWATTFRNVSEQLFISSRGQLKKMKGNLDEVMDYLGETPFNWLLGPLYSQLQHAEHKGEEGTTQ